MANELPQFERGDTVALRTRPSKTYNFRHLDANGQAVIRDENTGERGPGCWVSDLILVGARP